VKVVDMSLEADMQRETRIHHSEKPLAVIRHLASMFVDSTTRCIDPTAGSGRPLQAIHSLGAHVLGLEKVPEIHAKAASDWARYLQESSLSSTI
jgi:DNA modification methylase